MSAAPLECTSPTADWIERSLQQQRDLDRHELRALVRAVGARPWLWSGLARHDPEERQYLQLYADAHVDVWLLTWICEQETGFHDHDVSSGAVYVCEGELLEDRYEESGRGRGIATARRTAGRSFSFDASRVHRVRHAELGGPTTSLHAYSPPLLRMGHCETDGRGALRRVSVEYAGVEAA
jgi:hypothetical protein